MSISLSADYCCVPYLPDYKRSFFKTINKKYVGWRVKCAVCWYVPEKLKFVKEGLASVSLNTVVCKKAKCCRYRPGVAQRVGRGIALLFHDCGTRRG